MKSILVVDDSKTQAKQLEVLLAHHGYRVRVAPSAERALELLREERPDLVISDIVMPSMDGFELCKAIRADEGRKDIPVILMTSLNDTSDVLRALAAGADNFITKPYQQELLLERVRRLLSGEAVDERAVEFRGVRYGLSASRALPIELLVSSLEAIAERNAAVEQSHSAVERALDQARKAIAARDEVIAVVSHDLRNPLGNIVMAAKMVHSDLQKSPPTGAEATLRRVGMIMRAADTMTALINNLLDMSRIDAGALSLDRAPHELETLVSDAVLAQSPTAEARGIRLETKVDVRAARVQVDRDRMMQALTNLLSNAIKFSPDGASVEVRASLAAERGFAQVTVRDHGPGIAAENAQRVFDRFWQAKETAKLGTGLGLPIVKGIVEAHGGRVWLESQLGQGSSFAFTIPLSEAR